MSTDYEVKNTENQTPPSFNQTIIMQENKKNGVGTAGFVLALIGFFLSWVPVLGWIIWVLGLILSFVGVFKQPKGMAVAGLIISLINLILLILFLTVLGGLLGAMAM